MALAFLGASRPSPEGHEFVADIGSNDFYTYSIGRRAGEASPTGRSASPWGGGEGDLEDVAYVSPLQRRGRPLHPFDSRFRFTIPARLFSRSSRHVQLASYRDKQRNGPAVSRVVAVVPVSLDNPLMHPTVGERASMSSLQGTSFQSMPRFNAPRRTTFSFQESVVSRPMFIDGVLDAIRLLAPTLLEVLPAVLGRLRAPPNGVPSSGGIDLNAIVGLLGQLFGATPREGVARVAAAELTNTLSSPSFWRRASRTASSGLPLALTRGSLAQRRMARLSRQQIVDGGVLTGPLLAALMGPLLKSAPQLLQVLVDKPLDFLATLVRSGAEQDLQREQNQQNFVTGLLQQADRSMLMDELVARLGGADTALLPGLLAASTSVAHRRPIFGQSFSSPPPRESKHFQLRFETGPTIPVSGKSKSLYVPTNGLTLVVRITANGEPPASPLPRAIVDVCITDLTRQKEVLRKPFRLRDVRVDEEIRLDFTAAELAAVPRNVDLHVKTTMRWPASGGTIGVLARHAICLTDRTFFGRVEAAPGREAALEDVIAYRAFWNKLWEGGVPSGSGASRWKLDVVCRYYFTPDFEQPSNARIETRIAAEDRDAEANTFRTSGKMKSGLELSLDELNKLLPALGAGPALGADELSALKSDEFRQRFDLEATTRVRLRGDTSSIGVVWVYPSVALCEVVLLTATDVDDYGRVTAVDERRVTFPVPSAAHFLSLRSK